MQSKNFIRTISSIKDYLPGLSVVIILGTYLISAGITGQFITHHLTKEMGQSWINITIGWGGAMFIQLARGLIVFFPIMNTKSISLKPTVSQFCAILMAIASIVEVYVLTGGNTTLFTSFALIMAGGAVAELLFLKEVNSYINYNIASNKDLLKAMLIERTKLDAYKDFLSKIKDQDNSGDAFEILFNDDYFKNKTSLGKPAGGSFPIPFSLSSKETP